MRSLLLFTLLFAAAFCFADSGFGVSGAFTMDTVNPVVTITNPTLGQEILNGDTLPVAWSSEESHPMTGGVKVDWRPDPASGWNSLATYEPNIGLYMWQVNTAATDQAQVRVAIPDAFGNVGYGVSEQFTILPQDIPQQVQITSTPSGATVYIDGTAVGNTPYSRMIAPSESFTVSVQRVNFNFSPASITVEWVDHSQTVHFAGTYTGTGTVVTPFTVPDVWVVSQSPYVIPEPLEITADRNIIMQSGVEVVNVTSSPIQVLGSVNATGVTFRTDLDSLYWDGIQIIGSDSTRTVSNLTNCTILNASFPLLILNSSPLVDSLQIAPVDTLNAFLHPGIRIEGNSAPILHSVYITNYETGIQIVASEPPRRDNPSLTNIRIRSTSSSVRLPIFPETADPKGVFIKGCSSAILNDVEIVDYLTGVKVANDSLMTTSNPSLTNVRIRSTSSTARTPSTGIMLGGYNETQLNDIQIDGCNYGVKVSSDNPLLTSNPSLTNVRIRSTSSTARDLTAGILAGQNSNPAILNCQIIAAEIGIQTELGSSALIKNNVLRNCLTGISASSATLPPLEGNLVNLEQSWQTAHPGTYIGVEVIGNGNSIVRNNTFYGYPRVLRLVNTTCLFENNIAWHWIVLSSPFQRINSTLTALYNDVRAGTGTYIGVIASNNLNANPMFQDILANSFYLLYTSPCIDAGNPTSIANTDGTRVDMGAYPYLHKADFQLPGAQVVAGQNVTFVNTSVGHSEAVSIAQWDLNNDSSVESTTRDWSASFSILGTYSLKLTMTTGNLVDQSQVKQFQVVSSLGINAPANLSASIVDGQLVISWDVVPGAGSYKVMASDDPAAPFVALGAGAGTTTVQGNRVYWTTSLAGFNHRFYQIVASTNP